MDGKECGALVRCQAPEGAYNCSGKRATSGPGTWRYIGTVQEKVSYAIQIEGTLVRCKKECAVLYKKWKFSPEYYC